ncbi:MAG: putative sugar nucleotidyl transferase [Bacteroidota bacterium]
MNIILFDEPLLKTRLLPFTFIRPVAAIRIGILKIYEKWQMCIDSTVSFLTEPYLKEKFSPVYAERNLYLNGAVCPNENILEIIKNLNEGQGLQAKGILIAYKSSEIITSLEELIGIYHKNEKNFLTVRTETILQHPWQIFTGNKREIEVDFTRLTHNRESIGIDDPHTKVYYPERIFVEEGAKTRAAIINAEKGSIYIGKNACIHEGAMVRGTLALCDNAEINMGAKIRGDNTFGPYCKIGGEVTNSVFFGFSNKGHDGYLGNAIIGEWCNIGADSNSSNLKNNYSQVKVWDYKAADYLPSGLQFCGLMMGDHSKCGINTMFNTGTIVGIAAIIFGTGFPQKYIPSFTWGGISNHETFQLDKMFELAENVFTRKGKTFTDLDRAIFKHVFNVTKRFRENAC